MSRVTTKIAITAGHNARSQGVRRNGTSEYLFAKELIPEILRKISHIEGIEVREFERKYHGSYIDEMHDLHSRIDRWGANVDLELHFNAHTSTAEGHEVVYYSRSKGGRLIAGAMDHAFDQHLNNRDRNRKAVTVGERGSYGLRIGKSKSIITEPFFARELHEFMPGGSQRENLIKSYISFFENIARIEKPTLKKRTNQFSDEELKAVLGMF